MRKTIIYYGTSGKTFQARKRAEGSVTQTILATELNLVTKQQINRDTETLIIDECPSEKITDILFAFKTNRLKIKYPHSTVVTETPQIIICSQDMGNNPELLLEIKAMKGVEAIETIHPLN